MLAVGNMRLPAAALAVAVTMMFVACGDSAPLAVNAICEPHTVLLEETLAREELSSVFETSTGHLYAEVVLHDEGTGTVLEGLLRPSLFIIDAAIAPGTEVDELLKNQDPRFRGNEVTVAPGTYRVYAPRGSDVVVSECGS